MIELRSKAPVYAATGDLALAPYLASLAAALTVRAAAMLFALPRPVDDALYYLFSADKLARGAGYVVSTPGAGLRATASFPVGYPAAVAFFQRLTGSALSGALALNLLAALLATGCCVWVGERLAGRRGAYLAGLGYALYPGAAYWSAFAMTETVAGALLLAFCLAAHRAGRSQGWGATALAAAVMAAAVYVRPQLVLAATAVWLGPRPTVKGLARAAVILAAVTAAVLPWRARNCARLDACASMSTLGGYNLLIGTNPAARGGFVYPASSPCWREAGEVARDRCMTREAASRIRSRPFTWVALGALKVARTVVIEHSPVTYAHNGDRRMFPGVTKRLGVIALSLCWYALMALTLIGARRLWREGPEAREWLWCLGVGASQVFVANAIFLGSDRYHFMAVPLMVPLAAAALRFDADVDAREGRAARSSTTDRSRESVPS